MVIRRKKTLIWLSFLIPNAFNLYYWLFSTSPSYVMSDIFWKTFWVIMPFTAIFAYTQVDSGSYLPSFRKLGLPWHVSYFLEKAVHLVGCFVSVSGCLWMLTAFLISQAPTQYMTVKVHRLEYTRLPLLGYRYYCELDTSQAELANQPFRIRQEQYNWLEQNEHRHDSIRVRVQYNLAGASLAIVK